MLRLTERFRAARDDFDRPRVPDPLRDFVVVDRRDTVFFAFPRERARALRGLATDFLLGRRLRGAFEIALELFMTLRTVRLAAGAIGRRFSAALVLPFFFPAELILWIAGREEAKNLAGEKSSALIQIR